MFSGAGKRAAFAMYFGPLHFLLVREIVRALDARVPKNAGILDLGCGTGVAAAVWALEREPQPKVIGVDRKPIARRLTSWWDDWAQKWKAIGGREDEWRFRVELPERLALMDRASGLDHRELTGRSLWLPPLA